MCARPRIQTKLSKTQCFCWFTENPAKNQVRPSTFAPAQNLQNRTVFQRVRPNWPGTTSPASPALSDDDADDEHDDDEHDDDEDDDDDDDEHDDEHDDENDDENDDNEFDDQRCTPP